MNDSLSYPMLAWLLTYAIHSTVLLSCAWVVTRVRRLAPSTVDLIWKVALVGGIVTATIQSTMNVRPVGTMSLVGASVTLRTAIQSNETGSVGVPAKTPEKSPASTPPTHSAEFPTALAWRPSPQLVATTIWALAAFLLAVLYLARRLILVGRLGDRRLVRDGELAMALERLCREVGYKRRVRLTATSTISSPVALGRGEICVPEAAITELDAEQQRSMLAHELAHLDRRDPLWLEAAALIERIFFFQPLNRLARREIATAAEYLCDAWAARNAGSGIPLAKCLAKVAEWIEASPLGVPVAGMAEERSLLVSRISRLIEGEVPVSPFSRRLIAVTACVVLVGVVIAAPGVSGYAQGRAPNPLPSTVPPRGRVQVPELPVIPGIGVSVRPTPPPSIAGDRAQFPVDSNVVIALMARLKDDDAQVRAAAARSLGRLEDRRAVPGLIATLKDANPAVRSAAAESLGDLEDARAIPSLVAALADVSKDVRRETLGALAHFEEGIPAAPITHLLDDSDKDIRHEAVEILGRLKDRSSVGALSKLLADKDAEVRSAAIDALGEIGDESAAPALIRALTDSSPDVREQALQSLENLHAAVPTSTMIEMLRDPSPRVRIVSASLVGQRSLVGAIPALRKLLDDPNGDVREEAVDALSNIVHPAARDALRAALTSSDPKVRRRAAEALGERGQ